MRINHDQARTETDSRVSAVRPQVAKAEPRQAAGGLPQSKVQEPVLGHSQEESKYDPDGTRRAGYLPTIAEDSILGRMLFVERWKCYKSQCPEPKMTSEGCFCSCSVNPGTKCPVNPRRKTNWVKISEAVE
jgi:hypothetical protein